MSKMTMRKILVEKELKGESVILLFIGFRKGEKTARLCSNETSPCTLNIRFLREGL